MTAPEIAANSQDPITVIGAGLSGAACAIALLSAGVPVRLIDRGRAVGGRMASPFLHGRRVDVGAGYFTVRDSGFEAVVRRWADKGLARPWTDTFGVLALGQAPTTRSGPMRWATTAGLRSLVKEMVAEAEVESGQAVSALPPGDVVLAMPDPQAARLTSVPEPVECTPTIALVAGFAERAWPFTDAAFVHDHPALEFVADDGTRRGDGAPVLVVHSTAPFAQEHLERPDEARDPMVAAVRELLDVPEPEWTHAHRWTFAKPAASHDTTFGRTELEGRTVWFAGDQWCPTGSPRVESAWRSGTDVAAAVVAARR